MYVIEKIYFFLVFNHVFHEMVNHPGQLLKCWLNLSKMLFSWQEETKMSSRLNESTSISLHAVSSPLIICLRNCS